MLMKVNMRRMLCKSVPILTWAREYNTGMAIADMMAGITVALTLIPQSIAYASLAGLEPQYGLYSSFAGSLVYIFLGTTPEINIGPTALLSLLTFTYTHHTNTDFVVLLCLLTGVVQFLFGFSRMGFLVDFMSIPVVSGFTSAAALIIACSQIKSLLGLSFKAENFLEIWAAIVKNIHNVRPGDAILSAICCIILITMRKMKDVKLKPNKGEDLTVGQKKLQKAIWFTSVGRNAAVVIGSTVAAFLMDIHGMSAVRLSGKINPGLPSFGFPNFQTNVGNVTYSFCDMSSHLGLGIIVVPLIGILANVAIARAFSKGDMLKASQEIMALGVCNMVSSLVQSIPVSGSFSRSAVSNASGVKSPAAGFYTGLLVLLTLGFLTPYFYYIPKAALASVITCAVIFMIDITIIKNLWKNSKLDLVPLFGTFVACLFLGVEFGILVGIAVDIVLLLYYNARPRLHCETVVFSSTIQYTVVTPSGGLFFPSANYIRGRLGKVGSKGNNLGDIESGDSNIVVINCSHLQRADWTSLQGIKSILLDFKKLSKSIVFLHCRRSIKDKLEKEMKGNFIYCSTEDELKNVLNANAQDGSLVNWPAKQETAEEVHEDKNISTQL